jgi:hypothetical protein
MTVIRDTKISTRKPAKEMSLKEFLKSEDDATINKLMGRFNGGTYMACHVAFYEATGIWIPELVPIFQKMDAMVTLRDDITPVELR